MIKTAKVDKIAKISYKKELFENLVHNNKKNFKNIFKSLNCRKLLKPVNLQKYHVKRI